MMLFIHGNVEDDKKRMVYFTIVDEDGQYKLNVENFIGRTDINKEITDENNITITILNKKTYTNIEKYTVKIKNNSGKTILLDPQLTTNTTYALDTINNKRDASIYKLSEANLKVKNATTKVVEIEYTIGYDRDIKIEKLVFSKVVLDYENYEKQEDKNKYTDYAKIEIYI